MGEIASSIAFRLFRTIVGQLLSNTISQFGNKMNDTQTFECLNVECFNMLNFVLSQEILLFFSIRNRSFFSNI